MNTGGGDHGSQEVELNLAPIIDCFTVLITFMLASASFLSIGIFDAGIAASGTTTVAPAQPPSVAVTLELKRDHSVEVQITGKLNAKRKIASVAADGAWDFTPLQDELKGLQAQYSDLKGVTLQAENGVPYQDVILGLEATKKSIPGVLLGGF
jgi:biopolymer transport protein ExbD